MTWPLKTLDEIFEIARGGSPRPIDQFITDEDDGVNWIMIGDASNSSKHIRHTKKKIKPSGVSRSRLVKPGDFLLTNSMSFGRPYILDTHGCIHDGWLVLSPRHANVDHDYFYHLLGSPAIFGQFEKLAAGATVKNLNIDLVKSVSVSLPPLEEQKRIAAILDQADALRRKRKQALDRLNQLGQAIFYEMFGDPTTNPKAWPTARASELADRITVGLVVRPASYYCESGVPAIRGTNIKESGIDLSDVVYFSRQDNDIALAKSRIWSNDIVIVRSGRPGLAAIVPPELHGANAIDVLIFTPNREKVAPQFIRDLINSEGGKRLVLSESRGQVQQHFNVGSLSEAEFFVPPFNLQLEYQSRIEELQDQATRYKSAALASDTLFSSLQHRAFRGEL